MSPRASTTAKRAQRARANRITADPPGTHAMAGAVASWATSPATRRAMQANRRRDTAPEMAIRRLVHASGLRYRVDARPLPTARHTADMIFTRARVAVFIDGCWWHGCAEHYRPPASNAAYWAGKVARNRERDRLATRRSPRPAGRSSGSGNTSYPSRRPAASRPQSAALRQSAAPPDHTQCHAKRAGRPVPGPGVMRPVPGSVERSAQACGERGGGPANEAGHGRGGFGVAAHRRLRGSPAYNYA